MKPAIGLDIGGTKITGVVFDGKKAVKNLTIVTPKNFFEFQHNLSKLVTFLAGQDKPKAVGVGMAGLVDRHKGLVVYSPNIRYIKNFRVRGFFQDRGFRKIAVDNDASCFLLAEQSLGKARGYKNAVGVTLGTGIGGAFVINGKLYRGSGNFGGEVGRMVMAGSFWEHLYQKARDKRDVKTLTRLLAMGLGNLINLLDPECFVFGGAVAASYPSMLKNAVKEARKYLLHADASPRVFLSQTKNSAALGAALLVNLK